MEQTNNSEKKEIITKAENPDSLEIGTPAKGGAIKVYGDFNDKDTFQKKIDNAIELRTYANEKILNGKVE